ncbi:BLUF domain-containing protein [Roseovarius sp. E0-M6]|uniref:BLUF domain-containing protein n=1 Tax=Roseovarius sp. E0-M6 TaxID=3127118 RepID=UPI00300F87F1
MLYQLAYISRSQSPLDQATLSDILDVSRRNNARDGITGVLMYHDELFFQVLEGPKAEVDKCYFDRIYHDPRHTNLSLTWCDFAESRGFSDWKMGYAGPDEIGRYTKNSFQSLDQMKSDDGLNVANKEIALMLAKAMYEDFQRNR